MAQTYGRRTLERMGCEALVILDAALLVKYLEDVASLWLPQRCWPAACRVGCILRSPIGITEEQLVAPPLAEQGELGSDEHDFACAPPDDGGRPAEPNELLKLDERSLERALHEDLILCRERHLQRDEGRAIDR